MQNLENRPASILRTAAVLQVNSWSVRAMKGFFTERLGFTVSTEVGRGPAFVTLDRDGQTLMLACNRVISLRTRGWAAYFWTDDIERLFDEFSERGTRFKSGLVTKDYGCRELVVIAPDGSEIVFGQLLGP